MLVTELGIVTEVRLKQLLKADCPIPVTVFGIVIEVRLEQPAKAHTPILFTEFGIIIEERFEVNMNYRKTSKNLLLQYLSYSTTPCVGDGDGEVR